MASTDRSTGLMTLLSEATSNASPSDKTDATLGAPIPFLADEITVLVHSTAGSGTLTASIRMWGYCAVAARWYNLGLLNGGTDIAESDTDALSHVETLDGMRRFIRLYAEIESLGGTNTAVTLLAFPSRATTATH